MENDFMLRWPHHREVIQQILSGEKKTLGTYVNAKPGEFVELFSSPPLATGLNGTHGFPEPNSVKVIIRVSKFEKAKHGVDTVHWDFFTPKNEPDPTRSGEEEQYEILRALHEIGGDGGAYTPAEILAEATGIPLQHVKDHIDLLDEEDKVKSAVSTTGSAAYMQPRGRLFLRETAMPKKKSKSMPRRIFISHGRSNDWREVQHYIQRDVKFETLELAQEPSQGRTILQKLDEESDKCGYAVIVMTGDDRLGDEKRARENVIHEIGFFQGKYGLDRVCLLYEEGVNRPSNIEGLVYVGFQPGVIKAGFAELRKEIEEAFRASTT